MTRLSRTLAIGIPLILLVLGSYALFYGERIGGYAIESAMDPAPIEDPAHVGELIAGREVLQPVEWSRLKPITRAREPKSPICAAVYFASYGDRRNRGMVGVELLGTGVSGSARIDMATVKDGKFETVCFEGLTLAMVMDQPVQLRLSGLDGKPGSSVTVWLSGHDGSPRAIVDGEESERTLAYELRVRDAAGNRREQVAGWVLIFFAGLMIPVFLLTAFDRRLR